MRLMRYCFLVVPFAVVSIVPFGCGGGNSDSALGGVDGGGDDSTTPSVELASDAAGVLEASIQDGATAVDAGVSDAGVSDAADSQPGDWCVAQGSTHAFCSDFDGTSVRDGWDDVLPGGSYSAIESDRSSPTALTITSPPASLDGGSAFPEAPMFVKHVATAPGITSAVIAFDFRVDTDGDVDANTRIIPVNFAITRDFGTPGGAWPGAAQLDLRTKKTTLNALVAVPGDSSGIPKSITKDLADLPHKTWTHVEIAISIAPQSSKAAVKYDGVPMGEVALGNLDVAGAGGLDIQLGDIDPDLHGEATVLAFDNVLVDAN